MRILHCVFTRSLFGSERYAADLARLQSEGGDDVHMAVDPQARIPEIIAPGITVHRIGRLFRRWRLARLIRTLKPDIAHAHLSAACKTLGGIKKRPPAVATLHVGYKSRQHMQLQGLIALTARAESDARTAGYRGAIAKIWNWAPAAADPGPDAGAQSRAELGLADDAFIVGFVGRLHPSKDPETLVRAFKAAALPGATLLLAGEGPERPALERLIAGDPAIRLLGYRTDAPALYRAFDLFVLPSRFEQVPLAILEAMGAGLPMIVSNIESLAEFVPTPPAHLTPPGDDPALASLIRAEHARGRRRQPYDLTAFEPRGQSDKIRAFYTALTSGP
jgi:glycosyltransferase involved in cell wall biosynthesis